MRTPLVSIIIPVYNTSALLNRCIESIQKQKYVHFEAIFVNDGSTDDSLNIIEKWCAKDKRFKAVSKSNGGLSSARNAGISIANGEYFSFIDSDDWVDDQFLSKFVNTAIENEADIVYCNLEKVNEDGDSFKKLPQNEKEQIITFGKNDFHYFGELSWFACNKLFKASLFDTIKFPEGIHFEDIATVPRLFLKAERVSFTPNYSYKYFERTGSITQSFTLSGLDIFKAIQFVKNDYFGSLHAEDKEEWKRFWILQGFYSFGAYVARVKNKKSQKVMYRELSFYRKSEGVRKMEIINYSRFGKNYLWSLSPLKSFYYLFVILFKI